jgi:DNA invertase Pin-like site-specific DNA recombinase
MIYGYARVSTDGQSVEAQVRQLAKARCSKVFREVASGAKTDRTQRHKALDRLEPDDVLMVTPRPTDAEPSQHLAGMILLAHPRRAMNS